MATVRLIPQRLGASPPVSLVIEKAPCENLGQFGIYVNGTRVCGFTIKVEINKEGVDPNKKETDKKIYAFLERLRLGAGVTLKQV